MYITPTKLLFLFIVVFLIVEAKCGNGKAAKVATKLAKTAAKASMGGYTKPYYKRGISAWGIIGIILTVICVGTVIFFAFKFYPIMCAKRAKYDVMTA